MSTSRTSSSLKNISYSLIGQIISLLLSFILRIIFVKQLSSVYLGLDSLFTSLISMLSLAELGVGTAISYSLYKPLAEKDEKTIQALMNMYKKIYQVIGIAVLVIGIILSFFIGYIAKVTDPNINLQLLFLLFVINSSLSYFFSYKKTLIIADQYRYITTIYRYIFYVLMIIVQMIVLLIYKNYVLYLVSMIVFTFLENYFTSKKADKLYPFLTKRSSDHVDYATKNEIKRNTVAMSLHKVGGIVVNSTDNMVLSIFQSLKIVGVYSNYLLITNALNLVISQIFSAIVASIGNLGVGSTKEKIEDTFNFVFFCGFWIVSFCSSTLLIMFNPFINLWLGDNMLIPFVTVILIVINFYLIQIRKVVLSFRDALGLYWYDRYKPVVEAIINLILSIVLVQKLGLSGVLLGTITSTVLTSLWVEPYVLYAKTFKKKPWDYFKQLFFYSLTFIIITVITYVLSSLLSTLIFNKFVSLIVLLVGSILIYNIIFILFFHKNLHFLKIKLILENQVIKRFRGAKND